MTRKYRVVAEVPERADSLAIPKVGDSLTVRSNPSHLDGTVTEVQPILSAEAALEEIEAMCKRNKDNRTAQPTIWISSLLEVIDRYHASQENS